MADALNKRIFSGARGLLFCRGKQVAHFLGASASRTFEQASYKEAGSDRTQAIVLMGQDVSFSIRRMRFEDEDSYSLALMPGGEDGDLLDWDEMKAVILDRRTDKPMYEIDGLMPAREGFNFDARSLCSDDLEFTGRIYKKGSEVA